MSRLTIGLRGGLDAARALLGRQPPGAVVLAYHDIVEEDAPQLPYVVGLRRFREQLQLVARLRLQVVALADLATDLRAGRDVTGQVALVFDDALVGVHHLALPELAERGWPWTLHVVADALGTEPAWWPGSRRTMTEAEVAEAVHAGAALAAHGLTHACLPCLDDQTLQQELQVPRTRLQDLADRPLDDIAYPFGHRDERVRDAVRAAGYRTGWTFLNGRVGGDDDPWTLRRLAMHQGLTPARLGLHLTRRPQDWPAPTASALHAWPCQAPRVR